MTGIWDIAAVIGTGWRINWYAVAAVVAIVASWAAPIKLLLP
jgi:hypothetical protein